MSFDKLVVNASPIISLAKIECADFLIELSSELIIPRGVFEEITACSFSDKAVLWVRRQNPECIRSVKIPPVTLALLIRAKQAGLIPEVKSSLFALKANGFRVSSAVVETALRLAARAELRRTSMRKILLLAGDNRGTAEAVL